MVRSLIVELWMGEIIKNRDLRRDAKSMLQEWTQANGLGLPVYKVLKKKGLDHQPTFEIELKIKDFDVILGKGKSLQIAQKKTAEKFMKNDATPLCACWLHMQDWHQNATKPLDNSAH